MATINSTLISGAGAFTALLPLLIGKQRILLVTDANVGKLDAARQIRTLLEDEGRQVQIVDSVPAEPSQHDMRQILRLVSGNQPALIVGIGGGSVLDVAKLLSVLLHPGSPGLDALLAGEKPQQKVTSLLIPATMAPVLKPRQTRSWRSRNRIRRWALSPRFCCRTTLPCCRN